MTEKNRSIAKMLSVDKQFYCPKCHRTGHWGAGNCHSPKEEWTAGCHWDYCGWRGSYDEAMTWDWFKPWTDMNQAADFLIPVLGEMNKVAKLDILGSYIRCKWSHHKTTGEWIHGEGLKFSELMASAMCMVFLQVAEEYPELLKEALERLVA